MRRHAKASSAAATNGTGESRGLFGRAPATRGASSDTDGSGAPTQRRFNLAAPLAVAILILVFGAASATAAVPGVRVGATLPSDTALSSATLSAMVNPAGLATTYHFEYGKTTAYGTSAPAVDASAGSGTADVPVSQAIAGLDLNTTYHYRLVATNSYGTTKGDDLTFQTGPNLANGLHYEMVSPVDVNGSETGPRFISPDGSRIALGAGKQGFGDAESQHGENDFYLSTRTGAGWATTAMNPPGGPDYAYGKTFSPSPDLGTLAAAAQTRSQYDRGAYQLRLLRPGDLSFQVFPEVVDVDGAQLGAQNIVSSWRGASEDLTHEVVQTAYDARYLATDSLPTPGKTQASYRLYEVVSNPPALRAVALDNSGNDLAPVCFTGGLGGYSNVASPIGRAYNAVSADGSKIFFSARTGAGVPDCNTEPGRIFARIDGTETVEISASECTRGDCSTAKDTPIYKSASNDGSKVLFTTAQQLTNADVDTTKDLYLYDFAKPTGQHLSLASIGDATNATPGSGAQVKNVVNVSEDANRTYFVAAGILTTGKNSFGQAAQAGANNLYLYEYATGMTTFVGRFDAADEGLWVGPSQSILADDAGRYLVMVIKTKLAPSDTDAAADMYRYDAQSGEIVQVSPGNSADSVGEVGGVTEAWPAPRPLLASTDGSTIAFTTAAPLQANDVNGARDVYLWREGSVSLVSGGETERGIRVEVLVSSSGDEVAFATAGQMVPRDVDTTVSTYVAHTGADAEPPIVTPPPPCASSELCRGSTPSAPAKPAPVTPGFNGPGNDPTPKPAKNPHKKKHHKKKHHKKTHRAHKHSTHRAG